MKDVDEAVILTILNKITNFPDFSHQFNQLTIQFGYLKTFFIPPKHHRSDTMSHKLPNKKYDYVCSNDKNINTFYECSIYIGSYQDLWQNNTGLH